MSTPLPGEHRLIVLLHALNHGPEDLASLKSTAPAVYPGARILTPALPLQPWRNADPAAIATYVEQQIDDAVRGDDRITLVGYSISSLIARDVVVKAYEHRSVWTQQLDRLILLAGINRGWSFYPTINSFQLLLLQVLYYAARVFWRRQASGKHPTGSAIRN